MSNTDEIKAEVQRHYAAAAVGATCGTDACCSEEPGQFGSALYDSLDEIPSRAALASIGCGNPVAVAELRPGEVVLDLGSGGGIDVLLSARRVGPTGKAYGVDFTPEMLALANRNATEAGATNVEFLDGHIESIPLPNNAIDVVISNCVINLSTDKAAVFAEIYRVLRPGGRLGVSDVVTEDRLTDAEPDRRGSQVGCIAGALSVSDYRAGLEAAGFDGVSIEFTHAVGEGVHAAIVRAVKGVAKSNQIGEFLRARRAEVTPEQIGLASHGQRRVPGLRREELALLAGVSVGYYTRIEQGQVRSASPEVLLAVARALGLDDQERDYLLALAGPDAAKLRTYVPETVSPALLGLMDAMGNVASVLLGRRTDILTWSPLAHALIAPHLPRHIVDEPGTRPNWARLIFTDDRVRKAFVDWEAKCWDVAAYLRVQTGSHPHDALLRSLVGELSLASTAFDEMWTAQRVRDEATPECRMVHPTVGMLELQHVVLGAVDGSEQVLATFYASPGSPSAAALASLSRGIEG